MRIVIDMQGVQTPANRDRGIERFALSFVRALLEQWQNEHEVVLLCNAAFPESILSIRAAFKDFLPRCFVKVFYTISPNTDDNENNLKHSDISQKIYFQVLSSYRPDWVILTSLFEGYNNDAIVHIKKRNCCWSQACLVYDLIPWVNSSQYLKEKRKRHWYQDKMASLPYVNIIFTISDFAKKEILEHTHCSSERIINISAGVDPIFLSELPPSNNLEVVKRYSLNKPYILYVGRFSERKNIKRLISAFSILPWGVRRKYQLLLVGKVTKMQHDSFRSLLRKCSFKFGVTIKFIGHVPNNYLPAFYFNCQLFVYPSVHEGLGLPPLEAMASGAPAIVSSTTSLPEVVANKEFCFDPFSVDSIKKKMQEVLCDKQLAKKLIASGKKHSTLFTWKNSAQLASSFIKPRKLKQTPPLVVNSKPILAYVSPLPPLRTGIADYSLAMLPAMEKYYRVIIIVEQGEVVGGDLLNVEIHSAAWLIENYKKVDYVLYHMGNSIAHEYMLELIELCSGVVVMHDFYLSGLFYDKDYRSSDESYLPALYKAHGYSALLYEKEMGRHASIKKYPINLNILIQAKGLIVHSKHARDYLNNTYKQTALSYKVYQTHLAVNNIEPAYTHEEAREHLGLPDDIAVVCSFGLVDQTKDSLKLAEFWCKTELPDNPVLILVGGYPDSEYGKQIQALADNNVHLKLTGYVNDEDYQRYLASADIAVQLRRFSRGESSKTVLDCISHGLPVILNAHGAMAEIDADVVVQIPDNWTFSDLKKAITTLLLDDAYKKDLSYKAKEFCTLWSPENVAFQYMQAIKQAYRCGYDYFTQKLLSNVRGHFLSSDNHVDGLLQISSKVPLNGLRLGCPRLLLDITDTYRRSDETGIGRSVKGIVKNLVIESEGCYQVEAIYECDGVYHYAHQWMAGLLKTIVPVDKDEPVCWQDDDVVVGLDLNIEGVARNYSFLQALKIKGIRFYFLVYDILPLELPQHFPSFLPSQFSTWLMQISSLSNGLFAGSMTTSEALRKWLKKKENKNKKCTPIRLGADFLSLSEGNNELSEDEKIFVEQFQNSTVFLMVGTIEPRKGHKQVLAAFEYLWKKKYDVSLVIVGKVGWMMSEFLDEIYQYPHPELNRHLFIMPFVSDCLLQHLYQSSNALIAASEGEGLGLPLLEARLNGLPVIARRLPVFRETLGDNAMYFDGSCAKVVSQAVIDFIHSPTCTNEAKALECNMVSWKMCAQDILRKL